MGREFHCGGKGDLIFPLPCPQSRNKILKREPLEGIEVMWVVLLSIAVQGSNTVSTSLFQEINFVMV